MESLSAELSAASKTDQQSAKIIEKLQALVQTESTVQRGIPIFRQLKNAITPLIKMAEEQKWGDVEEGINQVIAGMLDGKSVHGQKGLKGIKESLQEIQQLLPPLVPKNALARYWDIVSSLPTNELMQGVYLRSFKGQGIEDGLRTLFKETGDFLEKKTSEEWQDGALSERVEELSETLKALEGLSDDFSSASSAVTVEAALERYRDIVGSLSSTDLDMQTLWHESYNVWDRKKFDNLIRVTQLNLRNKMQRHEQPLRETSGNFADPASSPEVNQLKQTMEKLDKLHQELGFASSALKKKDSTPRGGMDFAREVLETAGESAVSFDMVPLDPEAIRGLRVEVTILERAPAARGSYVQN